MDNAYLIATAWIGLALVASLVSIRLGISVALIEIGLGVVAGNAFGLGTTEWIDFLAAFGAVLLTFLAGAEIEPAALRRHARKSLAIGLVSFGAPFLAAWAFAWFVVGWVDRKIDQATRQARGTIRSLLVSQDMSLTNERGTAVSVRPADVTWRRVIVLDHPGLDDYVPKPGTVVLLRRDWEFLFDQLRSTYAVVEYLHRVSDGDPVPLGLEPVRYYELAGADAATAPSKLDERLATFASNEMSSPLLPRQPVGHGEDRMQVVVRAVLEDIAISPPPAGRDTADMLGVLAAVDAMPVAYRAELSRTLLHWLDEVARVREPAITWRFRIHTWPDRPLLLFAVSSRYEPAIQTAFASWVSLRHQEFLELFPERSDIQTVGVLLTPRLDGSRPWDTTMVATRGDQGLSADERALFEQAWGRLGERRVRETL